MYKKIFLTLALLVCMTSSVMAAETELQSGNVQPVQEKNAFSQDKNTGEKSEEDRLAREAVKAQQKKDTADKLNKKLSNKKNLKKPEEFKVITDCGDRASRNNVAAYVSFTCENDFTYEQLDVINRILSNGTTVQSLNQVYEFWLTTDEDFSVVEQICALESTYFSEFWYERAYNVLTDYEHGALNGEELIAYQSKGITTEQILAANVMCRKRGQNIYRILDSLLEGTTIEEQAKAIYGVDTLPEYDNLFAMVTSLAGESRLKNEPVLFAVTEDDIIEKDEIFNEVVSDKIDAEFERLALKEQKIDMYDDYTSLKNSEYPINVQRALMNKGYTPAEIERSALVFDSDYHTAAKKAREMMKNEK